MDLKLKNKTILVTASSGGIGLATSRSFLNEGARVVINGRSDKTVKEAESLLKAEGFKGEFIIPLVADASTKSGCDTIINELSEVDVLVNCLGMYELKDFFEIKDEDWFKSFETNVMGALRLSRYFLKKMLEVPEKLGRVVFISSETGMVGAPEMAHYGATKTMLLSISRSLAELTKDTKITVNTILPGPTLTNAAKDFILNLNPGLSLEEAKKKFISENRPNSLIGRFVKPSEVGDIIAFLCSPQASIINGATIKAEGGTIGTVF